MFPRVCTGKPYFSREGLRDTHTNRQATQHGCLTSLLGDGDKGIVIVYGDEKNILYWADHGSAKAEQNLLYRGEKPKEPTKTGPLSFVLFDCSFTWVSTVTRGHPSLYKFFAPSGFQSILIWMHICDLMVMNLGNFSLPTNSHVFQLQPPFYHIWAFPSCKIFGRFSTCLSFTIEGARTGFWIEGKQGHKEYVLSGFPSLAG